MPDTHLHGSALVVDEQTLQNAGLTLDEQQLNAVRACVDTARRVVAFTGKAGTGKTTIIKFVYKLLADAGYRVALAAPTGKAAKRIKEATGLPAVTFHRLLEFSMPGERDQKTGKHYGESTPKRNRQAPLEYDVVIGDEYAMVNQELHGDIVGALPNGGRLVVCGDINQLPPIEKHAANAKAPSAFKQMLDKFSGITLATIHRTGSDSTIAIAGDRILRGMAPAPASDFKRFIDNTPIDTLIQHAMEVDFSDVNNQCITPTNISWVGQHKLNAALQSVYRQEFDGWYELERHPWDQKNPVRIRVGDKVVMNQNYYTLGANNGEMGIFNGEVGIVRDISEFGEVEVDLGDRTIVIPPIATVDFGAAGKRDLKPQRDLALAYALTTHKCQGSEYSHVTYVINKSQFRSLNRYNFYTAITRARQSVCLICDSRALSAALSNTKTSFD